jgi:hypothetical protein
MSLHRNERGNVLFYILIAVALFAALIYTVSRGGREGAESIGKDRTRLLASEMLEYGTVVANATTQIRLRGTAVSAISFASPALAAGYGTHGTAPANEIFNLSGGGVTYAAPAPEAMLTPSPYVFTGSNEVNTVGTTCGGDGCADLLMAAEGVKNDVCLKINDLVSINNNGTLPPADASIDLSVPYAGSFTYVRSLGDEAGSSALKGHAAGCFRHTANGKNVFYQVLYAR